MIRVFLTLSFLLISPAAAQQIKIRSGAHEDFTRLVLDVPAGAVWSVEQSSTGAELTIDGHSGGFDTSSVFDRIDRSFISSVSSKSSSINVEFSCTCDATVFDQPPNMIVLDVYAKQSWPEDTLFDTASLSFVGSQTLRLGQTQSVLPKERGPIIDLALDPTPASQVAKDFGNPLQLRPVPQDTTPPDGDQLQTARNQIARQIGTAATRGILSSVGPLNVPQTAVPKPQIDTKVFDVTTAKTTPPLAKNDASTNIRISNSSVILPDGRTELPASHSGGLSCIDPQLVSVRNWGTEDALSQRVSLLRSQLFGEFDQLDPETALQLARTYIYFGFGAEARQILLLDRSLKTNNPELLGIAEILELGHSPNSEYLSRFLECDSDAALWAILSVETIDPAASINVIAALRSASALPMHLRKFIAPELSKRLLSYGDTNSASAALRSLERGPEPLNSRANLAKADIELSEDNIAQAQERLAEIVTSNTEQSAKALIKFVDSHLAEDSEIDEDVATLVEAYAREMRGDPLEIELRRTHVLALGKSRQFSKAFDALSRMRERNTDMLEYPLRSSVLDLLTRNADDVEFLEHAFVQIEIEPETLTPRSLFQLARRLADLGFWTQAELSLNSGKNYSNREQVALLRAEIALALGRPFEALAHLFGLDTETASFLRAKAEASAGDFSTAHSIYTELGSDLQSQRAAWLSKDWSMRVESATPVFGPMVSVAQSPLDTQTLREGMLERTATALSESQNARAAIQELLTRTHCYRSKTNS